MDPEGRLPLRQRTHAAWPNPGRRLGPPALFGRLRGLCSRRPGHQPPDHTQLSGMGPMKRVLPFLLACFLFTAQPWARDAASVVEGNPAGDCDCPAPTKTPSPTPTPSP